VEITFFKSTTRKSKKCSLMMNVVMMNKKGKIASKKQSSANKQEIGVQKIGRFGRNCFGI
jgi:hypothetical protein